MPHLRHHLSLASTLVLAAVSACGTTQSDSPGASENGGKSALGGAGGASRAGNAGDSANAGATSLAGASGVAGATAQAGAGGFYVGGAAAGGEPTSAGAAGQPPASPEHPNIVVILTDDTGWNGTSVQMLQARGDSKSDYYETPNIARLSGMGMTFGSGYGAPNCSPSRLSLQTGKTPSRLKMTDIIGRAAGIEYEGHPLLPPGEVDNPTNRIDAIPADEQTIAEMVKAHDSTYATAHFGKWHLDGGGPAKHGYDVSDGATGNEDGQVGGDDPKLMFTLAERSQAFIRKQASAGRHFYLQISHYATHEESFALPATVAKYQAKTPGARHKDPEFAAMTENLDTAVGRTLDALQDPNGDGDSSDSLLANTYVLLLSDNGAVDSISDNAPLAAGKATTYEGGVRVPFLVAGPGIAPGSRSIVPVTEYDILPTVADWLGATPAPKGALDGGSFAELAQGDAAAVRGRGTALVSHFPHYQVEKGSKPMSSIRDGNLKLVHFYETGEDKLYDLSTDLGEQTDLAAQQPEPLRLLRRQLRDYLQKVQAPMPRLNPEFGNGAFPDVDQDGLNDDWEFRQLLTTRYSGSDDPDGDGIDNAKEFAKKTDPLP
jgi:arylsulfatase A-like enzyme